MELRELVKLLGNFAPDQVDALAIVAVKMATIRAESWTGEVSFSLNANQGAVGDVHVNRREVVRIGMKKRGVRG
jgi:hypothetical protein